MSTKITVTTNDWPVNVMTLKKFGAGVTRNIAEKVVPPHSEESFYLTVDESFSFAELDAPKKEVKKTDEPKVAVKDKPVKAPEPVRE